jgi:hypothetical protein
MQRVSNAARESMVSALELLLAEESFSEWALEYVHIMGIDPDFLFEDELFFAWLLYFASDGRSTTGLLHPETAAARYIEARHGTDERRRFIDLARRQPLTYWRVESIGPGPWVALSDMLWPRRQRVFDPELAETVPVGRAILGHVVVDDSADEDVAILAARAEEDLGPWPQYWVRLLAERAAAHLDTPERIMNYDIEVLELFGSWQQEDERLLMPVNTTSEGHPTVLTTLDIRYEGRSLDALLGALAEAPDFELDARSEGASTLAPVGWNGDPLDGGPRRLPHGVCGVLFVADGSIRAHTNSTERADALVTRLGELIGEADAVSTEEAEAVMFPTARDEDEDDVGADDVLGDDVLGDDHPDEHLEGDPHDSPLDVADHPPEQDADLVHDGDIDPLSTADLPEVTQADFDRMEDWLRKTFLAWADQPHPGLGDRSPRELVEDPEGAVRIRAILDDWQARARHAELAHQDFDALRASLGLEA